MITLVTGASGFLGSYIVECLLRQNFEVRCLVRNERQVKIINDLGGQPVFGDIRSLEGLFDACIGVDYIFHTAAKVSDWGPWNEFYSNTVLGTSNIIEAAIRSKVKKMVHISTVDVYNKSLFGSDQPRIDEYSTLTTEDDSHYYARAKLLAERKIMTTKSDMKYSIIRPATIYGLRDSTIFPRVIEFLENRLACLIKGFDPVLGLVHAKDVADLCVMAAVGSVSDGKIYNASSNEDMRLREYIRMVCSEINVALPKYEMSRFAADVLVAISEGYSKLSGYKIEPFLTRGALGFFVDDQRFQISKAKNDLGWCPKIELESGMKEVIQDFLSRRDSISRD